MKHRSAPGQISLFDEVVANPERGQLEFHQSDGEVVRFQRPRNFFPSYNGAHPHLDLRVPWLRRLELRDRDLVKHFRQYDDFIYRLERIEDLNGNADRLLPHGGRRARAGRRHRMASRSRFRTTSKVAARASSSSASTARGSNSRATAYDARGRMTAAECAFGMSVRYYWHPERDLLLRWHNTTLRSETHFTYDDDGRVLHTRTNGIWNDDRFRYDPANRETTYLPSGEERLAQRFAYDENDNVTHETERARPHAEPGLRCCRL